jgi:TPR repeat protein
MFLLDVLNHTGEGMPQNHAEAIVWYRKAGDAGNTDALFNIGMMYDQGTGVHQSVHEAITWYSKAAGAGSIESMNTLGLICVDNSTGWLSSG